VSEDIKEESASGWRGSLHTIVFESETTAGRIFDISVICLILLSVAAVMLESIREVRDVYGYELNVAEWFFTVLFTFEYILRLMSVRRPLRYALSFYGLVDLIAVVPTYLGLLLPGTQFFLTVRILRLLRIFRILKLAEYTSASRIITSALSASRKKILVFLVGVITIVTVVGSLMYVVEGEENGFINIPTGIYWAIVTLTTVGYGDLSPQTALGKAFASLVMILGYGIIAVPTGIVTAEFTRAARPVSTHVCPECHAEPHELDAIHCKYCGSRL